MKREWKKFLCLVLAHDWTCNAAEGREPTKIERETRIGYLRYAQEWCRRCERTLLPSEIVLRLLDVVFPEPEPEPEPKPKPRTHNSRWAKK